MFDDWKKAWQEAVSNFQRELEDDDDPTTPTQFRAMRKDLQDARRALDRLQLDVTQAQEQLAHEVRQEAQCRRRSELAAGIGDDETVRIANEWAERHVQRALILRQKSDALSAELNMRSDDLRGMEVILNETQATARLDAAAAAPRPPAVDLDLQRSKQDQEFRRMDRAAREKAAEARLEELKKRMS